jgi:hypothetical protein
VTLNVEDVFFATPVTVTSPVLLIDTTPDEVAVPAQTNAAS